jgi:hypothetical protein
MVGVKLTNNGKTAGTDSQIQQRLNHSAKNAFSESSRKRCISGLSWNGLNWTSGGLGVFESLIIVDWVDPEDDADAM